MNKVYKKSNDMCLHATSHNSNDEVKVKLLYVTILALKIQIAQNQLNFCMGAAI